MAIIRHTLAPDGDHAHAAVRRDVKSRNALAWTPFCIPELRGHTRNKTLIESATVFAQPPPGLDSLIFTVSLDLTALDPYGDQNILLHL